MSNHIITGKILKIRHFNHVDDFEPLVEIELTGSWEVQHVPLSRVDPTTMMYYIKFRIEDLESAMIKGYDLVAEQTEKINYFPRETIFEERLIDFGKKIIREFDDELDKLKAIRSKLMANRKTVNKATETN